jgi:hypothetical protein
MAAPRKESSETPDMVKVKGPNGLTIAFPKGVAEALLKNKAEYTRAGSVSSTTKS